MRNNQPVTQREVELKEDDFLISRTDTKGRITYANPGFIEISGFSQEELLGSPHNLVRHPDMPVEAFANMWETLKSGESWSGLVKNRRKNGDHYWVHASVTPIIEEGELVGYASLRVQATREAIEEAERSYALIREGRGKHLRLERGRLRRRGMLGRLRQLNLRSMRARLTTMVSVSALLLLASGGLGLFSLNVAGERIHEINQDGLEDVARLQRIEQLMTQARDRLSEPVSNPMSADVDSLKVTVDELVVKLDAAWGGFIDEGATLSPTEQAFADGLDVYINDGLNAVVAALDSGDFYNGYVAFNEVLRPKGDELSNTINELVADKQAHAASLANLAEKDQQRMVLIQGGLLAFGLLVLGLLGMLTIRALLKPLRESMQFTQQISAGNLAANVPTHRDDETGRLIVALNTMRKSLGTIIGDVNGSVEVVGPAARDIAQGNEDLSSRTEQQAASLQETASSMEEMTTTVRQNAENARQASTLAVENATQVGNAGELMNQVVDTMERITASSRKMTEIIDVIESIAFQTNILALNASVEAARAGEHGRGFAVVAEEVRSLAGRSSSASKEIRELISGSAAEIDSGAGLVKSAEAAIGEVVSAATRVNDIMGEITAASEEQSSGITQINQAIAQMDEVTQQNATRVQSSARAASELEHQTHILSTAIAAFRLRGVGAEKAQRIPSKVSNAPALGQSSVGAKKSSSGEQHSRSSNQALKQHRQLANANDDWEAF
ncbi:MAG: chemotaxis protein [Halomonadaceae bacterium]|nr:chemotaxis protein [Halomonadaceae bacterium]